jgi:hypothetical protein
MYSDVDNFRSITPDNTTTRQLWEVRQEQDISFLKRSQQIRKNSAEKEKKVKANPRHHEQREDSDERLTPTSSRKKYASADQERGEEFRDPEKHYDFPFSTQASHY